MRVMKLGLRSVGRRRGSHHPLLVERIAMRLLLLRLLLLKRLRLRLRLLLLNRLRLFNPDLCYLVVPEQHKDGAWHFHGLLANTGKMKFSDSGKKDKKGKKIYNMSKWSNGFTTATAVSDVYKVSKYVGKYITKELCEMTKGKQRYFVSQNMPDPDESVFLIDDNSENFAEFLSVLVDSMGYEVIHVSEKKNDNVFVGVNYFELQDRINIK